MNTSFSLDFTTCSFPSRSFLSVASSITGSFTIIYNVDEDEAEDPADLEQIRAQGVALGLRRARVSGDSQNSGTPRNIELYRGRAPADAPLYQADLKTGSLRLVNEATGDIYIVETISPPTSGIGHSGLMFDANRVL